MAISILEWQVIREEKAELSPLAAWKWGLEEPLRGFLLKGNRDHKIGSLTGDKGRENLTKGLPFPFRTANFLAKWNENECAVDAGLGHCLLTQQHIRS